MTLLTYKEIINLNHINYDEEIEKEFILKSEKLKKFINERFTILDKMDYRIIVYFLNNFHNGMRKGDKIPEMQHFLNIASDIIDHSELIRSSKINVNKILKVALLHDLFEDYGEHDAIWENKPNRLKVDKAINYEILKMVFHDQSIVESSMKLSKFDQQGKKIKSKKYYRKIGEDPEVLLIKMLDRKDSLTSMKTVFTDEKKENYVKQYKSEIESLTFKFNDDVKLMALYNIIIKEIDICIINSLKKEEIYNERKNEKFTIK